MILEFPKEVMSIPRYYRYKHHIQVISVSRSPTHKKLAIHYFFFYNNLSSLFWPFIFFVLSFCAIYA